MTWLIEKKAEYAIKTKDETYQFYVKQYPELAGTTSPQEFLYATARFRALKPDSGDVRAKNLRLISASFYGTENPRWIDCG